MPAKGWRCTPECRCGLHNPPPKTDQWKSRIGISVKLTAAAKRGQS